MNKRLTWMLVLSLQAAGGACLPVSEDRILGRDLALLDPRFARLPATFIVGSAPVPGARRVLGATELARIARSHGIESSSFAEMCFEIPLRELSADDLLPAMRAALPAATIAIIELSSAPVPPGKSEFNPAGLEPVAGNDPMIRIWRGFVRYSATRRSPVWARVRVSQPLTVITSRQDLVARAPINAAALQAEERNAPPGVEGVAVRVSDVAGRIPNRNWKAGIPIPLSLLEAAPDVRRGDAINVQVVCGAARLQFSAIAGRDARSGEVVELRNPASGRLFRARLEGPRAVVVVAEGAGL